MERERRRREKSFLFFFFFLYFLPFFSSCLCIFRPIFSAPIRRVTYIDLEKSSQHIAKHCQQQLNVVKALFYIFLFVVFFWRAATYTKKKKRRRRGSIGPLQKSRFIASRENLKIFSYKFVYFEQETRKGKRHRDGSHVMATAFVQRKTHQVPQCYCHSLLG